MWGSKQRTKKVAISSQFYAYNLSAGVLMTLLHDKNVGLSKLRPQV